MDDVISSKEVIPSEGQVFECAPRGDDDSSQDTNNNTSNNVTMKLRLRPMRTSDYDNVLKILPLVSRCPQRLDREAVNERLRLPNFHCWCMVVEEDCGDTKSGEIVGYVELHRMAHMGRNYDARLERVVVAECARGRRIATTMCEYVVRLAHERLDCNRVDLTVENPKAKKIYEKAGFVTVDTTCMRKTFQ